MPICTYCDIFTYLCIYSYLRLGLLRFENLSILAQHKCIFGMAIIWNSIGYIVFYVQFCFCVLACGGECGDILAVTGECVFDQEIKIKRGARATYLLSRLWRLECERKRGSCCCCGGSNGGFCTLWEINKKFEKRIPSVATAVAAAVGDLNCKVYTQGAFRCCGILSTISRFSYNCGRSQPTSSSSTRGGSGNDCFRCCWFVGLASHH